VSGFWARLLDRPVLVWLGAAALTLFGLAAVATLPIRASPIIPTRLIEVATSFPGADPATMDKFVTLPLEGAMGAVPGVAYVTGTSAQGHSDVKANLADGAAPDIVFARGLAAVNAARGNLPVGVQAPVLSEVGDDNANQELNVTVLFPPSLTISQVTAYVSSSLIPRFETVPGIGPVYLYTGVPDLRVRMDPVKMAALGVTPLQIAGAVSQVADVQAAGTLRNAATATPVNGAAVERLAGIAALPVVQKGDSTLDLGRVASPAIAFDPGDDVQFYDNKLAVYIAAGIAPGGNIITVAQGVRRMAAELNPSLPPGLSLKVTYDMSIGVSQSLHDLVITLVVTILLVGFIVRLSLGSLRAALAPFCAIMLSLLGATLVMQITGQSFNLFTIIALVLAVGLVVDDAIVVVEDVFRRVAEGADGRAAARASVTRLAPVLAAISSTLVVAFLPLGFLSGLTAALFRPFALVLIAAFLFSLALALTVVPSMAMWAGGAADVKHSVTIDRLARLYARLLAPVLGHARLVAGLVLLAVVACVALAGIAPVNLDPAPDGLDLNLFAEVPQNASMDYVMRQVAAVETVMHRTFPGEPEWLDASEANHAIFGGYTFKTPEQTAHAAIVLAKALKALPGVSAYVNQDSGLPGADNLPVSVAITGRAAPGQLLKVGLAVRNAARASGDFAFAAVNPGEPQYQYRMVINRPLAAALGVSAADIGATAAAALSGGNLGQVSLGADTLMVTTQLPAEAGPQTLAMLPIATASGKLIPLGTVMSLQGGEIANALGSWQGLPSVTISGQPAPGVALSRALATLRRAFVAQHAQELSFALSGPSAAYQQSNQENERLFALGLAGLFFLLAAQFQSLRDPFVVITTVPLASLGPLLLFIAGGATLNIVTEIALLTVWGLIARQGILFVQVAHEARDEMPVAEAALRAARLRFRPILMITLALIGGAVPLILASGPEAVIRYDLGVVLATGMGSGFLLSLFAVPAMYCVVHGRKKKALLF
jgi:multidrug efflux pump